MSPITFNNKLYANKSSAEEAVRSKLREIVIKYRVSLNRTLDVYAGDENWEFLIELLNRHPELDAITNGEDIETFHVMQNPRNKKAIHLEVSLANNYRTQFSWLKCISQRNQTKKQLVKAAMREAIYYQIKEFKRLNRRCVCCNTRDNIEIDHCGEKEFRHLVQEYLSDAKDKDIDIDSLKLTTEDIQTVFDIDDSITEDFEINWQLYHEANATLQPLCKQCHDKKTFKRN